MPCIFCQSKYHDYRSCIVLYKIKHQKELNTEFKQDYFGKAPNVFVGKYGYPHIKVGILGAEGYNKNDDPLTWSKEGTNIPEIIRLRSSLVNSNFQTSIKGFNDRFSEIAKDISLAKRPVDIEIGTKEKPKFRITFHDFEQPHGPTVQLKKATITENTPIDTRVDKVVSANDITATEALTTLAKKGFDEHFLTKAFSVGNFGIPIQRKFVPTRWSITAVDDALGKQKIAEIKKHQETDCIAYFGGHLGNYYLILFFDDKWQYELFEQFIPSNESTPQFVETDYESYEGRKEYVHETAGGYYAARIGILENLTQRKRQSSVLAIRIITEEYSAPLGVWVVREAVRKAILSEPLKFADRNAMLSYAISFMKTRFNYDIASLIKKSLLVKSVFGQRKLRAYGKV